MPKKKLNSLNKTNYIIHFFVILISVAAVSCIIFLIYGIQANGYAALQARFFWIVFLVLLPVGILTYFIFLKYFKSAVGKHIEKTKMVEKDSEEIKIESAIYKLFLYAALDGVEKTAIQSFFEKDDGETIYKAIILRINDFDKMFSENTHDERATKWQTSFETSDETVNPYTRYNEITLIKYGMGNIMEEVLSKIGTCKAVSLDRDMIGAIVSAKVSISKKGITNAMEKINNHAGEFFEIATTSAISRDMYSIEELIDNAYNIASLSRYRFIMGFNNLIFEGEVGSNTKNTEYPEGIMDRIINSIKKRDQDAYIESICEFVAYTNSSDYLLAEKWTISLFLNILQATGNEYIDLPIISELLKCDTLQKAISLLKEYVFPDVDDVEKSSSSGDALSSTVQKMTLEHYSNQDYNIGYIADELGISKTHASRKFRKVYDKSWSNYLSEYRINVASEMLLATDKKVAEIGELCGFASTTYFVTIFKKHTLLTPQEYRESHKNKENNNV